MATQSDGKVIISTELDNSQLPKGVKQISGQLGGLKNVVKSLGTAIAAAFSVAAIVNFAKESVQAANRLTDALTGLKSILDGQGRSFSDAQKFLEEYTADGLVPMTNAITAYKNLASRGYDDTQIRQTLQALKDASAFGRQASYSMGEAVESATEGLKNENSILVDNAGVTKNVAKMWDEYAASIGTTANNLTQQQKIQAEVNGILEESKYQAGDAAKVAGTLSGQLSQLSVNFNNLKVAVGNALGPIVQSFLPVINAAVSALTRFANAIASVVAALFGSSMSVSAEAAQEVADGYNSAADGAGNLAKSTEAAGKAAKKYLAGFDEITKIGDSSSGGGSSGGSGGAVGSGVSVGTTIAANGEVNDEISPKIQAVIDKIHQLIEPLKNIDFEPAVAAFSRLGGAVGGLGTVIVDALEWAWFNILVPLAEWTIEEATPAGVNLLASAFEFLAAVLKPVFDGLQKLLKWLNPVFEFIGETAVEILGWFSEAFEELAAVFEEKGPEISGIFSNIGEVIAAVWAVIEPLLSDMVDVFGECFDWVMEIVAEAVEWVIDVLYGLTEFIAGIFTGDWSRAWKGIGTIFESTGEFLVEVADWILSAFGLSFEDIVQAARTAWNSIKTTTSSIWNGIKSTVRGTVNGIIGFINGMIRGIVSGINAVIRTLNKLNFEIPDWVPGFGGKEFGFNLKTISYPQIPYLAQGAVLPANKPFLAVVGDQKHGTNVEAPLATIEEAVANVMTRMNGATNQQIVALLRDILEAILGIEIDGETISRAVDNYNRKMAIVKGGRA